MYYRSEVWMWYKRDHQVCWRAIGDTGPEGGHDVHKNVVLTCYIILVFNNNINIIVRIVNVILIKLEQNIIVYFIFATNC